MRNKIVSVEFYVDSDDGSADLICNIVRQNDTPVKVLNLGWDAVIFGDESERIGTSYRISMLRLASLIVKCEARCESKEEFHDTFIRYRF